MRTVPQNPLSHDASPPFPVQNHAAYHPRPPSTATSDLPSPNNQLFVPVPTSGPQGGSSPHEYPRPTNEYEAHHGFQHKQPYDAVTHRLGSSPNAPSRTSIDGSTSRATSRYTTPSVTTSHSDSSMEGYSAYTPSNHAQEPTCQAGIPGQSTPYSVSSSEGPSFPTPQSAIDHPTEGSARDTSTMTTIPNSNGPQLVSQEKTRPNFDFERTPASPTLNSQTLHSTLATSPLFEVDYFGEHLVNISVPGWENMTADEIQAPRSPACKDFRSAACDSAGVEPSMPGNSAPQLPSNAGLPESFSGPPFYGTQPHVGPMFSNYPAVTGQPGLFIPPFPGTQPHIRPTSHNHPAATGQPGSLYIPPSGTQSYDSLTSSNHPAVPGVNVPPMSPHGLAMSPFGLSTTQYRYPAPSMQSQGVPLPTEGSQTLSGTQLPPSNPSRIPPSSSSLTAPTPTSDESTTGRSSNSTKHGPKSTGPRSVDVRKSKPAEGEVLFTHKLNWLLKRHKTDEVIKDMQVHRSVNYRPSLPTLVTWALKVGGLCDMYLNRKNGVVPPPDNAPSKDLLPLEMGHIAALVCRGTDWVNSASRACKHFRKSNIMDNPFNADVKEVLACIQRNEAAPEHHNGTKCGIGRLSGMKANGPPKPK